MKTKQLNHIVNELIAEGKDYSDFKLLVSAMEALSSDVTKDEILEFLDKDYRIQLHATHNSIAKLIAHLAIAHKPKNAIDICCGTGNILYYLQNDIDDLTGVEINKNVAELTKYFIPDLHIISADTFKFPFTQKYDLVVGNIPFGMRLELDGKPIRGEEAFLRKAHELLSAQGVAIILVPFSVLSNNLYQNVRNDLIGYLKEVVVLPADEIRNSYVKTALVVLSKDPAFQIKYTFLNQFNDLTSEYQSVESNIITKEELKSGWVYENKLDPINIFYKELDGFQTKELQELADIVKGEMIKSDLLQDKGDFLYLKPVHIGKDGFYPGKSPKYVSNEVLNEKYVNCILQPGDIVISTVFSDLKMYVYKAGDVKAIASNNVVLIRSVDSDYILSYLQTEDGRRIFQTQANQFKRGGSIPYLSIPDLKSIRIPILPVSDLKVLGNSEISHSTEAQLKDALYQLEELKKRNLELEKDHADYLLSNPFLEDRLDRIEKQLEIIKIKLDEILSVLNELTNDFKEIQKLPREDEEKLFKLYQKIDAKVSGIIIKEETIIEEYVEGIKRWLDLWDLLDAQSKKFLPIAEFIFDKLSSLDNPDFAPFVVQYCRTLENEILRKLFETYHQHGFLDADRNKLVLDGFDHKNTKKFAEYIRKNTPKYTLGEMNFIMSLLKQGGDTLAGSQLLQHFRTFTISYFEEKIVQAEFLTDLEKLTTDFRNKAAHPYPINVDLAVGCQKLLRKSLIMFLESIKPT